MTKRELKYHLGKRIQRRIKDVRGILRPESKTFTHVLADGINFVTRRPLIQYDCDKIDTILDEHKQWAEPAIPRNIQCSKSYMEAIRKLPVAKSFGSEAIGIEVRESSVFPYEMKWAACDIETKSEHQIPSGEWIHGVMAAPPPREQSIGVMMTETPAFHPYLDKVREEIYGYQYRFMTF